MPFSLRGRVAVIDADITTLELDAIVNAANSALLGGGGVDGAIHRKAGRGLLAECRPLNGCPPGQARITGGHNLPVKHIIHAVGPIWRGGNQGESTTLAACYTNSLKLCEQYDCETVAFPGISTGVYRFPMEKAASIAAETVLQWLEHHEQPRHVTFCAFGFKAKKIMAEALEAALMARDM
ncbi:MAG: O-acetyl-ADP-ribose deacetylase [Bradymonadia bacterium]